MRDPLDNKETAFEFFGVDMNLPHREVMKVHGKFIMNRKNAGKRQEAGMRMRSLRAPNQRLLQDIYLYDVTAPDDLEEIPCDFEKPKCYLPSIKPTDLGDAVDALEVAPEKELQPISAEKEITITYLRKFCSKEEAPLPLPLDK